MEKWEITWCTYSGKLLGEYLEEGWEPFAVSSDSYIDRVWLRRKVWVDK